MKTAAKRAKDMIAPNSCDLTKKGRPLPEAARLKPLPRDAAARTLFLICAAVDPRNAFSDTA